MPKKIRITQDELVRKTRYIAFVRHGIYPLWVSGAKRCCKCHWGFNEDEVSEVKECIVAVTDTGSRYFFHENCFNNRK